MSSQLALQASQSSRLEQDGEDSICSMTIMNGVLQQLFICNRNKHSITPSVPIHPIHVLISKVKKAVTKLQGHQEALS